MKNFFENKLNKGNPFVNNKDNKGDSENIMADEIKETEQETQEIVDLSLEVFVFSRHLIKDP